MFNAEHSTMEHVFVDCNNNCTHQNSWETHTPSHCTTLTTPNDTHRLSRGLRTCQLYTVVLSGLCAVLDQAHPTPPFLTQPRTPLASPMRVCYCWQSYIGQTSTAHLIIWVTFHFIAVFLYKRGLVSYVIPPPVNNSEDNKLLYVLTTTRIDVFKYFNIILFIKQNTEALALIIIIVLPCTKKLVALS